jgi:hypothetical protein
MIHKLCALIAAIDPKDELVPYKTENNYVNPAWKDVFLIIGGFTVLGILLFLWALLVRKPRNRSLTSRTGSRNSDSRHSRRGLFSRKRRRKRGHHHEERPRNPTLSETGGLPPSNDKGPQPS